MASEGGAEHPKTLARSAGNTRRDLGRTATFALALLLAACAAPVVVEERVPAPPPPFERYPYLLDVRPDGARIAWTSSTGTGGQVHYRVGGSEWGSLNAEVAADSTAAANLSGLPSGAHVEYRVTVASNGATPAFRFQTAPAKGARTRFRLLVWGDSGSGTQAQIDVARQIAKRHEDRPFDFGLHTGDVAYPHGSARQLTERHFRVYREWLSSVPVYPVPGNHDLDEKGGRAFEQAFLRPWGIGPGRRYHSFDYANAHFVALDSNEGDAMAGYGGDLREVRSAQRDWLERDLAAAARDSSVDWIIVYLHHPLYSAAGSLSGHGSDAQLRESLRPLLDRFGVDVVFSGHDHDYERSHPLRGDRIVERGTVYVVTGGGGGSRFFRSVGRGWWTALSDRAYHFVDVEIRRDTLRAEVIDREGKGIDRFVLTKR